ncbi:MAG: AraC family transcriptional regulator [Flavobacteriaceae bacterium]|mgnify:CR=1 FL=1|nr:AraC family transcriptional regulator [Flavobacteriaceae bacterium]|tara:strand:- start:37879 stop:38754 length:876 start_codon:yes stop_codon:yes gene_type:complete
MKNSKTPSLEAIRPSFGSSLKVSKYESASNNLVPNWHFHPEMEIVYVNGGSGKRHIGNHISYYSDGDLIFIGAHLPHFGFTDRLTGNKSEVVIQVKEDFLGTDFFNVPEMQSIKQLFVRGKQGIAFHDTTKKVVGPRLEELEQLDTYTRLLEFLNILKLLADAEDYTLLNVEQVVLESKPQDTERLDTIYCFVSKEFKRTISLSEIAQLVNMTAPAFSRYFKKKTNKTFTQFVNEYRLVHASKLLMEEQRSITDICFECGFNNFSHFSKKFKAYTGKSPSEYRNELKKVYA